MGDRLQVLLVTDRAEAALLILEELRRGGFDPVAKTVRNLEETKQSLESHPWDILIVEDRFPAIDVPKILSFARSNIMKAPLIVVAGHGEPDRITDILASGAREYLTWDVLSKLPETLRQDRPPALPSVGTTGRSDLRAEGDDESELEKRVCRGDTGGIRVSAELTESRERYRLLLQNANDAVFVHEIDPQRPGRFLEVNDQACRMLGYSAEEFLAMNVADIDVPEQKDRIPAIIADLYKTKQTVFQTEHLAKDGRRIPVEVSTRLFEFQGRPTVLSIVRDISDRKRAERALAESFERLRKSMRGIIQVIAQTVESRDPYTAGHHRRVSDLGRAVAQEMGLSADRVDGIRTTGLIHDLGKIAIPAEILSKPAKLNPIEYDLVKTHSRVGYEILKDLEFSWPVAEMILQHHERLDGSGYPRGLKGDQILLEARILVVADVVEAMATHRPYRPAFGVETALDEITRGRGRLYDPAAVDACVSLFRTKGFALKN